MHVTITQKRMCVCVCDSLSGCSFEVLSVNFHDENQKYRLLQDFYIKFESLRMIFDYLFAVEQSFTYKLNIGGRDNDFFF